MMVHAFGGYDFCYLLGNDMEVTDADGSLSGGTNDGLGSIILEVHVDVCESVTGQHKQQSSHHSIYSTSNNLQRINQRNSD